MRELLSILLPEIILVGTACVLMLLGVSSKVAARRLAPVLALAALAAVFAMEFWAAVSETRIIEDPWHTARASEFSTYVKLLAAGVGAMLVLLAWPTNADATGSRSLQFGGDAGEFFALMLLSLAGVFLVSVANDLVLLFLAIELASIPTYIMVSISRPVPAAQEAGVKYFFLGAMSAAVMLFGFSYLYGTTGMSRLDQVAAALQPAGGSGGAGGAVGLEDAGRRDAAGGVRLQDRRGPAARLRRRRLPGRRHAGDGVPRLRPQDQRHGRDHQAAGGSAGPNWVLPDEDRAAAVGAGGADHDRRQRAGADADQCEARAGVQLGRAQRVHAGGPDGAGGRSVDRHADPGPPCRTSAGGRAVLPGGVRDHERGGVRGSGAAAHPQPSGAGGRRGVPSSPPRPPPPPRPSTTSPARAAATRCWDWRWR